ncbi:nucleotidyltransferase domain-containing protein [Petrimonas sp.]|uniref:nucleotidyltransferase domain-containing protein n=1 Tax=Petrimonas sp. TaxID=2023866 RepID=UPI003F50D4E4
MFGLSDKTLYDIRSVFRTFPHVKEVLIFGSRAKDNYRKGSDIDLAVKGENITFDDLLKISVEIDNLELLYKVDVVDYHTKKNTPVGTEIDKTGKTFYKINKTELALPVKASP